MNDNPLPGRLALPADHNDRVLAARNRAQWSLGDPTWADIILNAYFDPATDAEELEMERTS